MTLEPLLAAPLAVQIHVATVLPAAFLGPIIFLGRKGSRVHKALGRVWLALMVASAFSSFFIHSLNLFYGFSPIHLLSAYVIVGAVQAVRYAQKGQIASHRFQMMGLYLGGIVGAGLFTFAPERLMNKMMFDGLTFGGQPSSLDFVKLALLLALFSAAVYCVLRGERMRMASRTPFAHRLARFEPSGAQTRQSCGET